MSVRDVIVLSTKGYLVEFVGGVRLGQAVFGLP